MITKRSEDILSKLAILCVNCGALNVAREPFSNATIDASGPLPVVPVVAVVVKTAVVPVVPNIGAQTSLHMKQKTTILQLPGIAVVPVVCIPVVPVVWTPVVPVVVKTLVVELTPVVEGIAVVTCGAVVLDAAVVAI